MHGPSRAARIHVTRLRGSLARRGIQVRRAPAIRGRHFPRRSTLTPIRSARWRSPSACSTDAPSTDTASVNPRRTDLPTRSLGTSRVPMRFHTSDGTSPPGQSSPVPSPALRPVPLAVGGVGASFHVRRQWTEPGWLRGRRRPRLRASQRLGSVLSQQEHVRLESSFDDQVLRHAADDTSELVLSLLVPGASSRRRFAAR